uniref:tRNA-uridine aminocarboxypropyltransferase 1 n=1 Tax=Phallusia mammillata TaxID=59560 RepID=A0A6F9DBZ1_9ASCI|nr:DTW domain-containing protein 1 [Phallusia mammillata]
MEEQIDLTPFDNFKISGFQPLQDLKRSPCPKCKASRMYFCYTCYKYVEDIDQSKLPKIKLPIPVDIIKHQKELDGKSTAIHAALIAPDDVHIYIYPVIPDYSKQQDVLLVFPGPGAHSLEYYSKPKSDSATILHTRKRVITDTGDGPQAKEIHIDKDTITENHAHDEKTENEKKTMGSQNGVNFEPTFKKVVLIDSTWNQVHGISSDKRLKGVKCVELTEQSTNYWRRQHSRPDNHLATIEAIHSFCKQYHEKFIGEYSGQYDNLLYFFKFFYKMVHKNKELKKRF